MSCFRRATDLFINCIFLISFDLSGDENRCPWTGTGIGHGNMLAFKVFVVGVNILCYFSIILLVWSLLDGMVA